MITNVIGYAAAVMGTLIMFPQLIKTIRTKSAKDVSMGMLIVFLANCFLWTTYGILIKDGPVAISNSLVFIILVIEIVLKIKYRK